MRLFVYLFAFVSVVFVNNLYSKSNFVSQIPNGAVNSCATCHTSNSNFSFNSFGSAIKSGFMSSGKVVWKAALATLDSDGDGFSNGVELQDPNGLWSNGSPAPGNANSVSNPGVKSSIPTSVTDDSQSSNFITLNLSPNPFTKYVSINYFLNSVGFVSINIFDVNGNLINTLISENQSPGEYTFNWNGTNNSGAVVSSGNYFVSIKYDGHVITKSINFIH